MECSLAILIGSIDSFNNIKDTLDKFVSFANFVTSFLTDFVRITRINVRMIEITEML